MSRGKRHLQRKQFTYILHSPLALGANIPDTVQMCSNTSTHAPPPSQYMSKCSHVFDAVALVAIGVYTVAAPLS